MAFDPQPLLRSWDHQRDYALRLVGDLAEADKVRQPVPGVTLNHPAWVLAHLTLYADVLGAILRGEPVADPIDHPHGRNSTPLPSGGDYPPLASIIDSYTNAHDALAAAAVAASAADWEAPIPIARWAQRWDRVAELAEHLMVHHESVHLGQLSAWRRALGLRPA